MIMLKIQPHYHNQIKFLKNDEAQRKVSPSNPIEKNNPTITPNIQQLNSKFNIQFAQSSTPLLDETCSILEARIKELNNAQAIGPNNAITSAEDIEVLNEVFYEDNIGNIEDGKLSLNSALRYLNTKGQIYLDGFDAAFMIDEMSLKDPKAIYDAIYKKAKFYCYSSDEFRAEKLIEQFRELTNNQDIEIKIIKKPENKNTVIAPDKSTIKNTIQAHAKVKFPNNKHMQEKFIKIACKYLLDCFVPFSYGSIAQHTRNLYKQIEAEVQKSGKTMDDVIYMVPALDEDPPKSFSLINYIYATENDVNPEQFLSETEAQTKYTDDKICVLIDDVSASGMSYSEHQYTIMCGTEEKEKRFLYAPIVMSEYSKNTFDGYEKINNDYHQSLFAHSVLYKDLKKASKLKESMAKIYYPNETFESYISNFKHLNEEDINFILEHVKSGFNGMYTAITFPYMIPDNSSEIIGALGEYFLNRNSLLANKGVATNDPLRLSREDKEKIKKAAEEIKNNPM